MHVIPYIQDLLRCTAMDHHQSQPFLLHKTLAIQPHLAASQTRSVDVRHAPLVVLLHYPGTSAEDSNPGLPGPNVSSVTSRADFWRQAKKHRAADWAAFNASRPDETFEAPADVAALAEAAATIGDFKLKSDPGYVLPAVSCMGGKSCSYLISQPVCWQMLNGR